MFKKFIALFIVCSVILVQGATYAAETDYTSLERKQDLLIALDIISPDSHGEIDDEKAVSRVDFAAGIGKLLNINPTASAPDSYYIDVEAGSWAAYTLNTLVDMKILSVDTDRRFYPYSTIRVEEAAKMLVCLLGYGEYAQYNGGYPAGYLKAAAQIDLLDGVAAGGSAEVTNSIMTALLYNAVHTRVMRLTSVGSDGVNLTNKDSKLMMTEYLNIDYAEGVVESADGFSLTEQTAQKGECYIGGVMYLNGDTAVDKLLGHKVRAYYSENNNKKTLCYLEDRSEAEIIIADEDIVSYKSGTLTYTTEDGKQKKLSVSSSAAVMRNGDIVSDNLYAAFEIGNGQIKLIENDGDNQYDTAIIEDYRTVVVNSVNPSTGKIVDEIKKDVIDVSDDSVEFVTVYNAEGDEITLSSIRDKAVIDIAYSKRHTIIYVNSASITGRITSLRETDKTLMLDGVEYKYEDTLFDVYNCENGMSGVFKTNRRGRIVCMFDKVQVEAFGYVIAAAKGSGFSALPIIKLLTQDGSVQTLTVSEKAEIDGEKVVKKNALTAVNALTAKPIRYRVNNSGEIIYIDSPSKGANEVENTLRFSATSNTTSIGSRWNAAQFKFGKKDLVSQNAVLFKVSADTSDTLDEHYSVGKLSEFTANNGYDTDLYKIGDSSRCEVVVWRTKQYSIADASPFLWVKDVYDAIDANGEAVKRVMAYHNGVLKEYDIAPGYSIVPEKGDIVRMGMDSNNKSEMVEIHYDYSRDGTGDTDPDAPYGGYDTVSYWHRLGDLYYNNRFALGYAAEIDGDILKWSIDARGSDEIDEAAVVKATIPIVIYDAKEDKFYDGSLSDVMTSDVYGDKCSDVFVVFRWGEIATLYVVNNRTDY